jgi:hypothetical protein
MNNPLHPTSRCLLFASAISVGVLAAAPAEAACGDRPGTPINLKAQVFNNCLSPNCINVSWTNTATERVWWDISVTTADGRAPNGLGSHRSRARRSGPQSAGEPHVHRPPAGPGPLFSCQSAHRPRHPGLRLENPDGAGLCHDTAAGQEHRQEEDELSPCRMASFALTRAVALRALRFHRGCS